MNIDIKDKIADIVKKYGPTTIIRGETEANVYCSQMRKAWQL